MNRINIMLLVANNKIRLAFKKMISGAHIDNRRALTLISTKCDIDFEKGSTVTIQNKVRVDDYTYIGVRKEAHISFGKLVYVNRHCSIVAHESIIINDGVTIGPGVCIYDHDHDFSGVNDFKSAPIEIGANTWIGANCVILKGVHIGRNCVIAAGTIVNHDIPDNMLVYQERLTKLKEIEK